MNNDVTMSQNLEETPLFESPFLYGTISCGADTWRNALGREEQIFSYDDRLRSTNPVHRTNYHRTKYDKYSSLNLIIVQAKTMKNISQLWMNAWAYRHRAANILVFHGQ